MKAHHNALGLILAAALWRLAVVYHPELFNVAPISALACCGAVFWRDRRWWLVPFAALTLSDSWLNYYHATHFGYTWSLGEMLLRTLSFAAALGIGRLVAQRPNVISLLSGVLGSSLIFYFTTNTVAWFGDAFYMGNIAGWWRAMTVGHPEYPPTLWFFRNTLLGDLFFAGLFVAVMQGAMGDWRARSKPPQRISSGACREIVAALNHQAVGNYPGPCYSRHMSHLPRWTRSVLLLLVTVALATQAPAQKSLPVETAAQRDARMEWWREARFGMFVHWGLYSGLAGTWDGKSVGTHGGMEWIQQRVKADTSAYAKAAIPLFQPKPGFAREWARTAKGAGCRYLVFTTKHHDGFALHDSKVSDFDAGSMLHRDLVKEIVAACRAEGLRVGFYYSVIDWHHDQYEYAKSTQLPHPLKGRPYPNGARDHAKYLDYLHSQVDELVSNYGKVDVVWWDYSAQDFQGQEDWRAFDLMTLVRVHQPKAVMNNRLFRIPEAGWKSMGTDGIETQLDPKYGDFITPEQHIPATGLPGVDWETCMTLNTTWGYSAHDHAWKSNETLIRNLVDIASKGGNYLLNIGPQGDGSLTSETVKSFHAIGAWMKKNGDAIYGTTANPIGNVLWGRITAKSGRLYLHVFNWPGDGKLTVPATASEGTVKARFLAENSRARLMVTQTEAGLEIALPVEAPDKIATVIELRGKFAAAY